MEQVRSGIVVTTMSISNSLYFLISSVWKSSVSCPHAQLGLGDAKDRNIPSQVPIEDYCPTNVSCGWWHTLVLAESPNRV